MYGIIFNYENGKFEIYEENILEASFHHTQVIRLETSIDKLKSWLKEYKNIDYDKQNDIKETNQK